jgi:glycosyltransferase involved in cell wall biosynthesis
MRILMVLSGHGYPPDGRVEREARYLIKDGHNLFLMARKVKEQRREEIVDDVHILRFKLPFQSSKAISDFIYFFMQRYFILFNIIRACRKFKIDALHVHDLPYALATALAGRLLRLPVVFDTHEHYTAMMKSGVESKTYRKIRPFMFILLGLMKLEERIACRIVNNVIVVADEHVPRIASLGVKKENIVVVTNTEDIDHFAGLSIDNRLTSDYEDDFIILYFGGFGIHRGLETAIQAMPIILKQIPNARLMLIGKGPNEQELVELTNELNVSNRVSFLGFQPFEKLPTYILRSQVSIVPHISTPHIETTMPNKIFQIMMLGRPVICSNTRPMMRVVNDAKCGLIFKERDPHSLADAIIQLKDEKLQTELGENGKHAVIDRYNWHKTVQKLLQLYNTIGHPQMNRENN